MLDLLDRAEAFALSNIRRRLVIGRKGMEREEIPEIPAEAIREAVANALCHRDYTAGVAFEYTDRPNFTALVFHRPGSQLEGGPEEFASSSQVVRKQFANENEEAVYAYLMANGPAGPTAIANAIGMTRRGTQKLLQRLVEQGRLEAKGATSNRVYYLAQED